MAGKPTRTDLLVWVDLETTGLVANKEVPLEVGVVLTDIYGDEIDHFERIVLTKDSWLHLDNLEPYVKAMHTKSGLLDEISKFDRDQPIPVENAMLMVEIEIVDWLKGKGIEEGTVEMCGSTISFDRAFLGEHMQYLHDFFHYRNMDISSLMVLCHKVNPELYGKFVKDEGGHRPISDIRATLKTYKFLFDNFVHATR